jgi:hypothetical protein
VLGREPDRVASTCAAGCDAVSKAGESHSPKLLTVISPDDGQAGRRPRSISGRSGPLRLRLDWGGHRNFVPVDAPAASGEMRLGVRRRAFA